MIAILTAIRLRSQNLRRVERMQTVNSDISELSERQDGVCTTHLNLCDGVKLINIITFPLAEVA